MCIQSASSKMIPKEKDFVIANKRSFGNMVGTITNYATSMYTVIVNHREGTPEWNELQYRITCMQDFQQNSIDLAKGIEYRPVPKEWYDWKINKVAPEDSEEVVKEKEFNQLILANKKPYFMIYNYDKLKKEYMDYYRANNTVCRIKLGLSIEELRDKPNKSQEEREAYETFAQQCPVNVSPSVINRIAWHIEKHFQDEALYSIEQYDTEKLKAPDIEYSKNLYNKVKALKDEYDNDLQMVIKNSARGHLDEETKASINLMLRETFKAQIEEACGGSEIGCNVMVDICYSDNKSKNLLWDMFGEQIIKNMIANGYDKLRFPMKDENGDFEFRGMKFKMCEVDASGVNS